LLQRKLEIALSSTDAVSGVSASYYSLNGKSFEKYTHPVTLEDDGNYTLAWYSVDQVGNREKEQERKFALDNRAPVTTFSIDGMMNKNYVSSKATIVLKSTDELSGVKTIYYRINQGQEVPYTVLFLRAGWQTGKAAFHFMQWIIFRIGKKCRSLALLSLARPIVKPQAKEYSNFMSTILLPL